MIKASFDTERISVRIGTLFSGFGLSANAWTVLALVPAFFGFAALVFSRDIASALLLFFVAGVMDAIDGAVARVTGSVTALGAFLDGVIDRYVEIMLYLGLLFYMLSLDVPEFILPNAVWVSLLIFGAIMPSFVTAYANHRGVVTAAADHRRMEGLIARAERLWIVYAGMFFGLFDVNFLVYFVALLAALANLTALQRVWFVVNYAKQG